MAPRKLAKLHLSDHDRSGAVKGSPWLVLAPGAATAFPDSKSMATQLSLDCVRGRLPPLLPKSMLRARVNQEELVDDASDFAIADKR